MRPPASDDEREVRELLAGAERPVVVPPFSAVRRRGARASLVPQALSAALVVVAAAALGVALRDLRNAATTPPTPPAASSPAATASTVPTATSSPPAPLSDRYGLVVGGRSPYVRSETDPAHVGDLPGELDQAAVSPDGGKVAYWQYASTGGARVLTVVDLADPTRPRSLLTLPDTEVAATSTFGGVIWSSDGQGLLIAVNSRDYVQQPVPDAPNLYAVLRQVDLATGAVREIAREAPGFPYYPIAWDRARGISAAGRWGPGGFTGGFVTIREGAASQAVTFPSTTLPRFVSAAPDASRVFAHNFFDSDPHALYVWSLADTTARSTLSAVGSERIVRAIWRNAREIVVSLSRGPGFEDGDRLEVWSLDGSRRVVMDAKHRFDAVRPDGTAAITSKGVVDLATGSSAELPDSPRAVASVLLKQSPRTTPPTAADERVVQALIDFARAPSATTFAALPLADHVALGLGDQLKLDRPSADLVRPDAWVIRVGDFQGVIGPFSALDFLAAPRRLGGGPVGGESGATTTSVGPHPRCASPPAPAPAGLSTLRRVSVQPKLGENDSCIQWWTVDVFLNNAGRIEAITLDLFGP